MTEKEKLRKKYPYGRIPNHEITQLAEVQTRGCPDWDTRYFDNLITDSIKVIRKGGTAFLFKQEQVDKLEEICDDLDLYIIKLSGIFHVKIWEEEE